MNEAMKFISHWPIASLPHCLIASVTALWLAVVPRPGAQTPSPAAVTLLEARPATDGTIAFRINGPQAKQISVLVDTMTAATAKPLTKDERGVWSGTLGPLPPDVYAIALHRRWKLSNCGHRPPRWANARSLGSAARSARHDPPAVVRLEVARHVAERAGLYATRIRARQHDLPGALSAPRQRRDRGVVDDGRTGECHSRQPHRRRQSEADGRRHALRPPGAWHARRQHADVRPARHDGVRARSARGCLADDRAHVSGLDAGRPARDRRLFDGRQPGPADRPGAARSVPRRGDLQRHRGCTKRQRSAPKRSKRRSRICWRIRTRRTARCGCSGRRSAATRPISSLSIVSSTRSWTGTRFGTRSSRSRADTPGTSGGAICVTCFRCCFSGSEQ